MNPTHQAAKESIALRLREGYRPTEGAVSKEYKIGYAQSTCVIEAAKELHSMYMLSLFGPPIRMEATE